MMTDKELNEMIEWCRKKLANEKNNPFGLSGKRLEGYEQAMKTVMSYLHSKKAVRNEKGADDGRAKAD